jgi:hypothetical protein
MMVDAYTNFSAENRGDNTTMERNSQKKPTKNTVLMLKDIGSVHSEQRFDNKRRATTAEDPMAEELRQMSRDSKSSNKALTEPSRRWLVVDRSREVGADRPWDGLASMGTQPTDGQKGHEQQQTRPGSKKSSSLNAERGSNL